MHLRYSIAVIVCLCIGLAPAEVHRYVLSTAGKACLIAEMDASLTVKYDSKDGKMESVNIQLPAPDDVTVEGQCSLATDPHAMMTLTFNRTTLTLNFTDDQGQVTLSGVEYSYAQDSELFPNASATGTAVASKTEKLLTMGADQTYFQCHSTIQREIDQNVTLTFSTMKVQAFNVQQGQFSKEGSICDQDKPTPSPTPTVQPTPTGPPATPKVGNWSVKADNGSVCIVAKMGVRFTIPYVKQDQTLGNVTIDLPTEATTNGSQCLNETQVLYLSFRNDWLLEMDFTSMTANGGESSSGRDEYSVHNISLTYTQDPDVFKNAAEPGAKVEARADGLDLFRTGMGMSFVCHSETQQTLHPNVTMDTFQLQVQAFKYDTSDKFQGTVTVCPRDVETNGIVPIAVGAALAALVFIVVIAYIIGRKRRYQGYEAL